MTAAEPVSEGKRARIEALWGAEMYNQFGCTEGSFMASESEQHDGMHYWTDMFDLEVVDERTGEPMPEGQVGILVFTPYWNNEITPFLLLKQQCERRLRRCAGTSCSDPN